MFSIVIPNYNGCQFLDLCLTSLQAQSLKHFEVIVVDNGSSDDSITFVQNHFPHVKIVPLETNTGFAHATNRGIACAQHPFIALLNNDTEVTPSWLKNVQSAFCERPDISCVTSKMIDFRDRLVLGGAGDEYTRGGLASKLGRGLPAVEFQQRREAFSACAGASVFRANLFKELGLLDEDFFANYEDIDFSLRIRAAGHKILYVPDAVVYHVGGATLEGVTSSKAVSLATRNMLSVLIKNWPLTLLIRFLPYIIMHQTLWFFLCVKQGRTLSHLKGILGVIKQLQKTLRKRQKQHEFRKISDNEFIELIRCSERRLLKLKLRTSRGLQHSLVLLYARLSGLCLTGATESITSNKRHIA